MVYHSHDSYLTIGEVREAFGTPIMGFYWVERNGFSLSRLEGAGRRHPCAGYIGMALRSSYPKPSSQRQMTDDLKAFKLCFDTLDRSKRGFLVGNDMHPSLLDKRTDVDL